MNREIFKKKNCLIVALILATCMVIGSFCDFQLSSAVFNKNSVFGIFFASYGQLPAMLCFSFAGTLLIKTANKNKKFKLVLNYVFGVILNAFALLGVIMDPMLYIKGMTAPISAAIAVVILVLANVLMLKVTKDAKVEDLKKFTTLLIATSFLALFIINMVKIPWGRPRMRMISEQPLASFQPWWVIGSEMKDHLMALGVAAEEFKSFPSGHTGNAACAILLGALPIVSPKLKGKEDVLFFSGVAFAFIVAFSRIIMGAHFLTDVTVGLTITFTVEVLLVNLLFKKNK